MNAVHGGSPASPARSEFVQSFAANVAIVPAASQPGHGQLGIVGRPSWWYLTCITNVGLAGGLISPSQPFTWRGNYNSNNFNIYDKYPGIIATWPAAAMQWELDFFGDNPNQDNWTLSDLIPRQRFTFGTNTGAFWGAYLTGGEVGVSTNSMTATTNGLNFLTGSTNTLAVTNGDVRVFGRLFADSANMSGTLPLGTMPAGVVTNNFVPVLTLKPAGAESNVVNGIYTNGNRLFQLGNVPGQIGVGGLWLADVTPGAANVTVTALGGNAYLNSSGNSSALAVGLVSKVSASATLATFSVPATATFGIGSTSTNMTLLLGTTGITNTLGVKYTLFGFTGTSVILTNTVSLFSTTLGTITTAQNIDLQPNDALRGTSCASVTNRAW